MSPHSFRLALLPALLALAAVPATSAAVAAHAARPARVVQSDLVPTEARQGVLDLASRLSHPTEPPPLSADLKTPFDFDKTEPDPTPPPNGAPPAPAAKGARETLETLAPLIKPSGTLIAPGRPAMLTIGQRRLKVGDKFTITFEGSDYDLELAAITSTSFTLRYKDEETTRPIKSGK